MNYQDIHFDTPKQQLMAYLFGPLMQAIERMGISAFYFPAGAMGIYVWYLFNRRRKNNESLDWYDKGCLGLLIALIVLSIIDQVHFKNR